MTESFTSVVTWIGIVACISQAAILSGLNLAFFSISRLRLEVEASQGEPDALRVRDLRKDANFLLVTLLWGNVAVNVLLTLLSDSVLLGVQAFFFSAIVITCLGEIAPQAYFSRNALRVAARFSPLVRVYQLLLYPVARPSAALLNAWLGPEGVQYYRERELHILIQKHIDADEAEIDRLEGLGALNFLAIDDLAVVREGEHLDPESVITLPFSEGQPVFPRIEASSSDPFLKRVETSGKKWIVVVDDEGEPHSVLNSDEFLRRVLFDGEAFSPHEHCHRPVIVKDPKRRLGDAIARLVMQQGPGQHPLERDVILVWAEQKLVITGADILDRLLQGSVIRENELI